MTELNSEQVLSVPRKIRSQEIVRRGFMSNFLFQNISNIFRASKEILDIIKKFPSSKSTEPQKLSKDVMENIPLDENGNVQVDAETVIGLSQDIFGEKIYGNIPENIDKQLQETVSSVAPAEKKYNEKLIDNITDILVEQAVNPVMEETKKEYGDEIKSSQIKKLERELQKQAEKKAKKLVSDFSIESKKRERERQEALSDPFSEKTEEEINAEFDTRQKQAVEQVSSQIKQELTKFIEASEITAVTQMETSKAENEKKTVEDTAKDHLRGFSRAIPSFLMAYGNDNVTLENFDTIIPDDVFLQVTSITLEQFRLLRDGGEYPDATTGELKHFDGHLFEPVLFNDSVKEFMRLRKKLANYFDENNTENIFDYIPPQKTNQIFTPQTIVKKMVDTLEEENPHCFDDPYHTFIDLYMKSGLYIAEIVKRLYNSHYISIIYPEPEERLKHIFAEQVYGLAPTEIIYKIATNFILGFTSDTSKLKHNFVQADALSYIKDQKDTKDKALQKLLNQLYD